MVGGLASFGNAGAFTVAIEGLESVDLDTVSQNIKVIAARAINATAKRTMTASSKAIREQIAFPARYLTGKDGNLKLAQNARADALEAIIEARARPTSLTRFVKGPVVHGRKSPTVEVGTGNREKMTRAFIMNLRSGNLGLAVRLKPGESLVNKHTMVAMQNGLYLLYGPSVDQVFRTVAQDVSPEAAEFLENEFVRLMGVFER